jgi:hypothetical protein
MRRYAVTIIFVSQVVDFPTVELEASSPEEAARMFFQEFEQEGRYWIPRGETLTIVEKHAVRSISVAPKKPLKQPLNPH